MATSSDNITTVVEKLWSVTQILDTDDMANSTVNVFAAKIQPKAASTLIKRLNSSAPLAILDHVKRVRKRSSKDGVELSIILCIVPSGDNGEWCSSKVPSEVSKLVEEYALQPFIATVSQYEACSREEWSDQCKLWPTSYHPNAVNPRRLVDFKPEELKMICELMRVAIKESQEAGKFGQFVNGAIIVNPVTHKIISRGHDETNRWTSRITTIDSEVTDRNGQTHRCSWHPLRHAVMVAIEKAAEMNTNHKRGKNPYDDTQDSKRQRKNQLSDDDERFEQYLFTGFDAYVTREPCAMCAMALLHQRVRRIFYGISNPQFGALGGSYKLHCMKGLNHHYQVFQVSLTVEDIL